MKYFNSVLCGALVMALFAGRSTALAADPDNNAAADIKQFIERIHLTEPVADRSDILIAKGHAIRWSDAFSGETIMTNTNHAPAIAKIFVIPFAQSSGGGITASIIGGIIESSDAMRTREFIETIELADHTTISPAHAPISNISDLGPSAISESNIGQLISVGNRRPIFDLIISATSSGQIDDAHLAKLIRNGFRSNGYSCAIAPDSFPQMSIWYAATCIRPIP